MPHSWAMLNVDAAFQSHLKPSKVGGVICNNVGRLILGFTKTTFARDALLAEQKGIREGLSIALDHGFKKLVLFSDCKMATQLLDQEVKHTNLYANVLCKCRELGTKFESLKILHCSREYNKIADMMAKLCSNTNDLVICNRIAKIFPSPPSYCMNTYLAECIGDPSMDI